MEPEADEPLPDLPASHSPQQRTETASTSLTIDCGAAVQGVADEPASSASTVSATFSPAITAALHGSEASSIAGESDHFSSPNESDAIGAGASDKPQTPGQSKPLCTPTSAARRPRAPAAQRASASFPVHPLSERQQIALLRQMASSDTTDSPRSPLTPQSDSTDHHHYPSGSSGKAVSRVNKRNQRGETPLHLAAIKSDHRHCKELIRQGADVNAVDYAGWSPLHEACNHGAYRTAKVLLRAGANVNVCGLGKATPLHDAAETGSVKLIALLLKHGADPQARNSDNQTSIDMVDSSMPTSEEILSLLTGEKSWQSVIGADEPVETPSVEVKPDVAPSISVASSISVALSDTAPAETSSAESAAEDDSKHEEKKMVSSVEKQEKPFAKLSKSQPDVLAHKKKDRDLDGKHHSKKAKLAPRASNDSIKSSGSSSASCAISPKVSEKKEKKRLHSLAISSSSKQQQQASTPVATTCSSAPQSAKIHHNISSIPRDFDAFEQALSGCFTPQRSKQKPPPPSPQQPPPPPPPPPPEVEQSPPKKIKLQHQHSEKPAKPLKVHSPRHYSIDERHSLEKKEKKQQQEKLVKKTQSSASLSGVTSTTAKSGYDALRLKLQAEKQQKLAKEQAKLSVKTGGSHDAIKFVTSGDTSSDAESTCSSRPGLSPKVKMKEKALRALQKETIMKEEPVKSPIPSVKLEEPEPVIRPFQDQQPEPVVSKPLTVDVTVEEPQSHSAKPSPELTAQPTPPAAAIQSPVPASTANNTVAQVPEPTITKLITEHSAAVPSETAAVESETAETPASDVVETPKRDRRTIKPTEKLIQMIQTEVAPIVMQPPVVVAETPAPPPPPIPRKRSLLPFRARFDETGGENSPSATTKKKKRKKPKSSHDVYEFHSSESEDDGAPLSFRSNEIKLSPPMKRPLDISSETPSVSCEASPSQKRHKPSEDDSKPLVPPLRIVLNTAAENEQALIEEDTASTVSSSSSATPSGRGRGRAKAKGPRVTRSQVRLHGVHLEQKQLDYYAPAASATTDMSGTLVTEEERLNCLRFGGQHAPAPGDNGTITCDVTALSSFDGYRDIRRVVERRWSLHMPRPEVEYKQPPNIEKYLFTKKSYLLHGTRPEPEPVKRLEGEHVELQTLRETQEKDRENMRLQQQVERERLILTCEKEVIRVYNRHSRAAAGVLLPPLSIVRVLSDVDVFNPTVLQKPPAEDLDARDKDLDSWVKETCDRFEKRKTEIARRHTMEADSLFAIQNAEWMSKASLLGITTDDLKAVPSVEVMRDYPLLPV